MDHGLEACVGFVVACRDPAEGFDLGEIVFDQVAPPVDVDVMRRFVALRFSDRVLAVVHSNDDTLSAEDMALGYKQLQRVEEAWRTLKSGLKLRPVYHRAPHRIHAHVALTVFALLLERMAE